MATDRETGRGQDKQKLPIQYMGKRNERPNVGGVSIRSRNGAPARRRCAVNGQMTKASSKPVRRAPPPYSANLRQSARESINQ